MAEEQEVSVLRCKYCLKEMLWDFNEETQRWTPVDYDTGQRHRCPKSREMWLQNRLQNWNNVSDITLSRANWNPLPGEEEF